MTAAILAGKSGRSRSIPTARYGSVELKRAAGRDMTLGVGLSAALNTLALLLVAWYMAAHPPVVSHTGIIVWCPGPAAHPVPHQKPDAPSSRPPKSSEHGIITPVTELPPPKLDAQPGALDISNITLPGDPVPDAGPASAGGNSGPVPSGGASGAGAPGTWVFHEVEPVLLTMVKPQYTDMARTAGIEGRVVVWMLVGRDGRVERAEVKQGVPLLNDPALEAARRWTFKPALADGHPVAVWVEEVFDFQIR